jgi:hypothetical protein
MKAIAAALVGALVAASLSACESGSPTPTSLITSTTTTIPPAPIPSAPNVSGTWNGTGSDSFSPELVTWVLTQSGASVTGTAEFNAVDPSDGSCASCHKIKKGTFTGTLSGTMLSVVMRFPAGGDVPTPICVADLSGTATVADRRITATYTGTDTCEGVFADGKIDLTRQ